MLKVYLCSRWGRRGEMRLCAGQLEALGVRVTSRWLASDQHDVQAPGEREADAARFAVEDIEDIDASDALVAFTEAPDSHHGRGGRHVELGYAIARGKSVIVCGPRENVFCWLPLVVHCPAWVDALAALGRLYHGSERH